jgi:hypothetical protein
VIRSTAMFRGVYGVERNFAKMEISIYAEAGQAGPEHQISDEAARLIVRECEEAGAHRRLCRCVS